MHSRYTFYQLSLGIKPLHFYPHSLSVESLNPLDQISLTDHVHSCPTRGLHWHAVVPSWIFKPESLSSFIPPTAKKRTEFDCIPNVLIVCKYQDKSTNIRVSEQMHIILHFPLYYLVIFFLCFVSFAFYQVIPSWQDQLGNVGLVKLILILFSFLCKSVQVWDQWSIMAHYTYEVHKCECKSPNVGHIFFSKVQMFITARTNQQTPMKTQTYSTRDKKKIYTASPYQVISHHKEPHL